MLKRVGSRLLGEQIMGMVDYIRHPERALAWGGPFNGQQGRRAIFEAIVCSQNPQLIVETGTYRGTTTEMLASAGTPVVTIEAHPRHYGFARVRLRKLPNVDLRMGDSRQAMAKLFHRIGPPSQPGTLFAYLDAHWNADLPLAQELDLAFTWDRDAIVMIDDFQVPDDPGYGYDDYGPGRALTPAYIEPVCRAFKLAKLYPKRTSDEETGARRGCVVLASEGRWAGRLLSSGLLRRIQ